MLKFCLTMKANDPVSKSCDIKSIVITKDILLQAVSLKKAHINTATDAEYVHGKVSSI